MKNIMVTAAFAAMLATGSSCLRDNEQYQPEDLATIKPDLAELARCIEHRESMIPIPHGIFQMGSTMMFEKDPNDQAVLSFMLDSTEVTVKAYRACVQAGACREPAVSANCAWGMGGKDDFPVNCVNYDQAVQYCNFVCARLPTEIEWEYAARGENSTVYPWGNDPPPATGKMCKSDQNCPVGQFVSTRLGAPEKPGLYDMAGSVWEWTSSAWPCVYPLHRDDPNCKMPMPTERVLRGGYTFNLDATSYRAAYRHHMPTPSQASYTGFRCARSM